MYSTIPTQSSLENALRVSLQRIRPNPEYVKKLRNQLQTAKEVIIEQKPVVIRTLLLILAFAGSLAFAAALFGRIFGKR